MIRTLLAVVLLLPFASKNSEAFVFRKVVYSSPVEGVIHWGGKPLPGVVVTRELYSGGFEGGSRSDSVKTDSKGKFNFSAVEERRFLRPDLLSANPHVSQFMRVLYRGESYLIWVFNKADFDFGTEAKGDVLQIECDLSASERDADGLFVRCKHNGNLLP